jgi:cytochrome c peroxidase
MKKISFAVLCLCLKDAYAFTLAPPSYRTASNSRSVLFMSDSDSEVEDAGKRNLLTVTASVLIGASCWAFFRGKDDAVSVNYKDVSSDIADLIKADPDKGPTLVRLAWHSSGTYDKMTKTGGSGLGTIHFKEELDHAGNGGLESTAVAWMEPIKQKYGDALSYADLYTLGGVTAIKTLSGPTIPWSSGRVDALDPSAVTPDDRLPNADSGPPGADPSDAAHIRTIFNRMGFNDQEIVALSGAHALGRCHVSASGYEGPWTATPTTFNNLYYIFLNTANWTKRDWDGKFQYEDGSKRFMMLPSDLVLIQDEGFKKYVDLYSQDEAAFFKDFTAAFTKLEELGTKNLVKTEWA